MFNFTINDYRSKPVQVGFSQQSYPSIEQTKAAVETCFAKKSNLADCMLHWVDDNTAQMVNRSEQVVLEAIIKEE